MKFNKSEILKRAWVFVKTLNKSLSEALRKAWREAKEGFYQVYEVITHISVGDIFKSKNYTYEIISISGEEVEVKVNGDIDNDYTEDLISEMNKNKAVKQ